MNNQCLNEDCPNLARLKRETERANAWVNAVRELCRELGYQDDDSNGSAWDFKQIRYHALAHKRGDK